MFASNLRTYQSQPRWSRASGRERSPVAAVLTSCRQALIGLAVVSGVINLLMLTGSLFMMQVYDRVLSSRSVPTLVALSAIVIAAYLFQGTLDIIRSRVLALIGERIDGEVGPKVHAAVVELPLRAARGTHEAMQPFRDLEAVRGFLAGPGPAALFDLPWVPIYAIVAYLLHPLAVAGALVLVGLTVLAEAKTKAPGRAALEAQSQRNRFGETAERGADVIRAMGMLPGLEARWLRAHEVHLEAQRRTSFIAGGLSGTARMFRMILQSAVLGLGAYLAILGEITAGSIIAASILASRALAPIDQAIAGWKGFVAARDGAGRLKDILHHTPEHPARFTLPAPSRSIVAENLSVAAPGGRRLIIRKISLRLAAGQALGIIGPSAGGKSTLARALVGVWQPQAGKVMLDGASIDQWSPETLGPHIGYLPQDVQLFDGTVADNIARFEKKPSAEAIIAATEAAGFHSHVLEFPSGYETRIGAGGAGLSAGQKQRLGLARALYGNPFLVVLDEPNANLDAEGEKAVTAAIEGVKARNGCAVVIAHRPSVIAAVDLLLVMKGGEAVTFGPRDEVMHTTLQNADQILRRKPQHREARKVAQNTGPVEASG